MYFSVQDENWGALKNTYIKKIGGGKERDNLLLLMSICTTHFRGGGMFYVLIIGYIST